MSDQLNIADFLSPLNLAELSDDEGYKDGQMGRVIAVYEDEFPDLGRAHIVLVGIGEQRGAGIIGPESGAANAVRREFFKSFYWHTDVGIADIGNIKPGASYTDSYAALRLIVSELTDLGKLVVILGGSHDLTIGQYQAYAGKRRLIDACNVDAMIDLNVDSPFPHENFLMDMLTGEPNYIRHYNHIGFQSYFVHPRMLETMDKLRFDCYRVGHVKENIEEMEPVIRNSDLFSFDISAIASSYAPSNKVTPNGFNGEEACILMRYAGMSPSVSSIGIYGYQPQDDIHGQTAKQVSHMLWYLIDGQSRGTREAALTDRDMFTEYHTAFAEVDTTFLQSRRTGRWWMQMPDQKFIACSYKDYLLASSNEIPERWLRAQERN
ncbi:MAG: arginase [Chitinophagaceae bacterium]|nr:MAG: arginase [Chitinophagaceae bacterium]